MNLPNLLTLLRIFFVPLLVATLLADNLGARWPGDDSGLQDLFALAIFLAAARRIFWMDTWPGAGAKSPPSARCWIPSPNSS